MEDGAVLAVFAVRRKSLLLFSSSSSRGFPGGGRENGGKREERTTPGTTEGAAVSRVAFRGVIVNGEGGRGASQQVAIYLGGCILSVSIIYAPASPNRGEREQEDCGRVKGR
jgi:hypothetical protein